MYNELNNTVCKTMRCSPTKNYSFPEGLHDDDDDDDHHHNHDIVTFKHFNILIL